MLRSDPAQPGRVSKHVRYLMQHILAQPRSAFRRSPRSGNRVPSGTFFDTVNLLDPRSNLLVARIAESTRSAMIAASRFTWTTRISTQSSTVSWRTRWIGRIRCFVGALTSGCILPGGGAAAMNRNKLANGSDAKRRNKPGARPVVRQRGAHRPQVEAEWRYAVLPYTC